MKKENNVNLKKVTCTFYTNQENSDEKIKELILHDSILTAEGLIQVSEKEVNINFTRKENLIAFVNNNHSIASDKCLFNIDVIEKNILDSPVELKKFRAENNLYSDITVREYMPYKLTYYYTYEHGRRRKISRKSYDTFISILDVEKDKEELEKKRITDSVDLYYISTKVCNGKLIGVLEPVEYSYYLDFIDLQPSNMLVKFLCKKLGTPEDYENKEYINIVIDRFKKVIKKLIKDKNQDVLITLLRQLITNNLSTYIDQYNEKYGPSTRYTKQDIHKYTIEYDTYKELLELIKPSLTNRNLINLTKELLSKSPFISNDYILDLDENLINKIPLADFIARDILSGTTIFPLEYEDFLFNKEHKTCYEIAKARTIRIILDSINTRNIYSSTYANSSWCFEICRNAIRHINYLLLTKENGVKIAHHNYNYNYDIMKYEIDKDKNKFLFNGLTDDEIEEIKDIFKHIFKLFFTIKELPDEIRVLDWDLYNVSLDFNIDDYIKEALLDTFEKCEGRETSTVKSIIRNNLFINGVNIFESLSPRYTRLRELKMRTILQKN